MIKLFNVNFVVVKLVMVALWNRADQPGSLQTIIFLPCGFFFLLLLSFFPRLISAVTDWMSAILAHIVALVRISDAGLKRAARGSLQMQDAEVMQMARFV